jgi:hypothetical protein
MRATAAKPTSTINGLARLSRMTGFMFGSTASLRAPLALCGAARARAPKRGSTSTSRKALITRWTTCATASPPAETSARTAVQRRRRPSLITGTMGRNMQPSDPCRCDACVQTARIPLSTKSSVPTAKDSSEAKETTALEIVGADTRRPG